MSHQPTRRHFLQTAATAGLGLGEWAKLAPLSPATAAEVKVTPDLVRFSPDIEPVVRLIEQTPRAKCPAMMIAQLKKGLPYRNFLAALYLANLRTAEVAHPLAVLHSTNQLTLDAPVQERLLPTFWAMDSFKFHQERGDFARSLKPLAEKLPPADRAEKEFHAGMKAFDTERAERAVVALARSQGAYRVIEPLWHYAARDWSIIGHMAIWVANTWRTLQTVGWRHAEHMLRVVVRSLLDQSAVKRDLELQPYSSNEERVRKVAGKLPADWTQSGSSPGLVKELLAVWRDSSSAPRSSSPRKGQYPGPFDSRMTDHAVRKRDEACQFTAAQLVGGKVTAGAIWDAVHLAAGELYLSNDGADPVPGQPIMGRVLRAEPLHANTVANALHYAFRVSGDSAHRLLIVLQAVGWLFHFRENVADKRGLTKPRDILKLEEAAIPDKPEVAAEAILAARSQNPNEAAAMAFSFPRRHPYPEVLFRAAGRLLPMKASWNPHDIKFPVAMFEDHDLVSPEWRPHRLAVTTFSFLGTDQPDTELMRQVREALRKL